MICFTTVTHLINHKVIEVWAVMQKIYLMILPVLTVSTIPYQVYVQTEVRTTEPLAVIDPR